MAEEAVTIALQTVRDLLIGEINFLRSVSKQVEEVQTELKQMQSFLKDADSRQTKEESIRNLVKEIRSLAYRIENVLDTYAIEVASKKERLGIQNAVKRFVRILCKGKSIHKVGLEIENIKTSLRIIKENFVTLGVTSQEEGQSSNAGEVGQRKTYPHEVEEYFVGMEKDINQLVSLVTDEERAHRVISIHGMGGLGKTTLARKIYNHVNVQRCYQGFAWVSISKEFKKETIFRSILKQLLKDEERKPKKGEEREQMDEHNGKKNLEKMDETELVTELYQVQKARKCLVVLDDLWEINDWNLLSAAFPFKEANSKILMTTRNRALAQKEFAYELGHLSEDECWDLLRKKAFSKRSFPVSPEDAQVDPQFEDVGREIIRECGRLPLAISVLGGILSEKVSLHDWRIVSHHVDTYLRRSENSKDEYGAVSQVLALSYDSLPYHLKPCFLYLGHFREDEDIDVEMLYQMWTAEGMILSGKEETSMHVAEYYLSEMAQRSMVQVKVDDLSITKRLKSCRLHDLVRDFCLVYGSRVEFLQVLDSGGTRGPLSDSSTDKPCRYSIHHLDDDTAIPELYKALEPNEHLRSLLLYCAWFVTFPQKIGHLKSFKFLRVLNILKCNFKRGKLPKAFKMLIHLRFLRLRECYLKKVQAWIGNFLNLQTLELHRRYNGSVEVPNVLWKLKQLRHLYLPDVDSSTSLRVYGLSKLETLANFFLDEGNLSDLSDLINLRRLHVQVRGDRTLARILNHLNSNQHKLEEVRVDVFEGTLKQDVLACLNLHHLSLSESLCKFQDLKLSIPSNLIELELYSCELGADPMEALGKLSSLRSLTIDEYLLDLKLQKMICHPKSFPELRYLTIGWLLQLRNLEVLEGAMPKLSYISIDTCPDLEMIPEGLRFITGIKELNMRMPKEFNDRVRVIDGEGGVDFHKISHIPLVSLTDYDEWRPQVLRRAIEEDSGSGAPSTSINQAACFRGIL